MGGMFVIVQARMTSTRLPGKVLMDLGGRSVLAHTLARCAAIPGIDGVCCAVPDGSVHDPVAAEADGSGFTVFRGSEHDVLDRYWRAAKALMADVVMRVTSDCPLIDPEVCGRVLHLVTRGGYDYSCNDMPPTWPHGLDCEAFTFDTLDRAVEEASTPQQREHVTPWMRVDLTVKRANLPGPGGWTAEQRWTLDYPEDLEFLRAVFAELKPWPAIPTMNDVLHLLKNRSELLMLNVIRRHSRSK